MNNSELFNLVGITITILAFLLVLLLWVLQYDKDKLQLKREFSRSQLELLPHRAKCFMHIRTAGSELLRKGVLENSMPLTNGIILDGAKILFSDKFNALLSDFSSGCIKQRGLHQVVESKAYDSSYGDYGNVVDKETELINSLIDMLKELEAEYAKECKI